MRFDILSCCFLKKSFLKDCIKAQLFWLAYWKIMTCLLIGIFSLSCISASDTCETFHLLRSFSTSLMSFVMNWWGFSLKSWNACRKYWSLDLRCCLSNETMHLRWTKVFKVLRFHWFDANKLHYIWIWGFVGFLKIQVSILYPVFINWTSKNGSLLQLCDS